ncbi:MAG TPA: hypothetical protein EYP14_20055 [Planctomycetaceae bacterium]|nr:hypothetical protein [Planctomycetaceae bacterium]
MTRSRADLDRRNREIAASDAPVRELMARYNLSRASIYRIRKQYAQRPPASSPSDYANSPLRRPNRRLFAQLAVSGLPRAAGAISAEFQRELQLDRGAEIYEEMAAHPVVSAVLFAIRMAHRNVRWWVEPASDSPEARQAAEFVEGCMDDMAQSWDEVVSQILSMLKWGFALCELVYKKRLGYKPPKYVSDPARSRFSDGLIGWRRWQFILPPSLAPSPWVFDAHGRVEAVRQQAPPHYRLVSIPIEKLLLFRTEVEGDNPEGRSLLRAMYSSWYYATNLAEIEAIAAERLGAGLPVAYLGDDCTFEGEDNDLDFATDLVRNLRADEQMGIVIPRPKMGLAEKGKGMLLELLSPPSRGLIHFSDTIARHEQRMALSVLAQFIFLGLQRVGTQALAKVSTDFFTSAVGAWADAIADVINRFAIPRLISFNPFPLDLVPRLRHSELDVPDLDQIGRYVNALVNAQIIPPYPELARRLTEIADLPRPPETASVLSPASHPAAESFALRLKRGGPKWERQTNEYQRALQGAWEAWAEATAKAVIDLGDEQEREEEFDRRVDEIIALLILLGRRNLPSAVDLGLAGLPPSPLLLQEVAQAVSENEMYLLRFGEDVKNRFRLAVRSDPALLLDVAALAALLLTYTARVGLYAGTYWSLIQRGLLDRARQQPEPSKVPVRWVLDPYVKQHCASCLEFAGTYPNMDALLARTAGVLPGAGTDCDGNCRCHLELKIPGKDWSR